LRKEKGEGLLVKQWGNSYKELTDSSFKTKGDTLGEVGGGPGRKNWGRGLKEAKENASISRKMAESK